MIPAKETVAVFPEEMMYGALAIVATGGGYTVGVVDRIIRRVGGNRVVRIMWGDTYAEGLDNVGGPVIYAPRCIVAPAAGALVGKFFNTRDAAVAAFAPYMKS